MESDDISPLEISREDDSLLQNDAVSSLRKNNDDFLFSCSPLNIPKSTGRKMEKATSSLQIGNLDIENCSTNKLEVPDLCVEPQPVKKKKKCRGFNLRKSLAWDRAFFTEEGVLNPAELSQITGCSDNLSDMSVIQEEPLARDVNKSGSKRSGCPQPVSSSSMKRAARSAIKTPRQEELLVRDVNRSGSKCSGCPQPVSSSSTKRAAGVSLTNTPHKESKLPKIPVTNSNQSTLTSKSATAAEMRLKHNSIPQPSKFQKNPGSRAPSIGGFVPNKIRTLGSVKKSLPAKSSVQQARRNLTEINVQNLPVSRKDIGTQCDPVPANLVSRQLSGDYADGSSSMATLPPSTAPNRSGILQYKKLGMAKPSGLRKPSPSMGYFNLHKSSNSHEKLSRVLQPSDCPSSSTPYMSMVGTSNMTGDMGLSIAAVTTHERSTTGNTRISKLSMKHSVPSSIIHGSHEKDKVVLEVRDMQNKSTESAGSKTSEMSSYLKDMKLRGRDKQMLLQHEFHDLLKKKNDDEKTYDSTSKNIDVDRGKTENLTLQHNGASGLEISNKYQDVDVQVNSGRHLNSHAVKNSRLRDKICEVDWISCDEAVALEKSDACVYQSRSFDTCSTPLNSQVNGLDIPGPVMCLPEDDVPASSNNSDPSADIADCTQHRNTNKLPLKYASLGVGSSLGRNDKMTCDLIGQIHSRVQAYGTETSGKVNCFLREDEPASYVSCKAIADSVDNKSCGSKIEFSGLSTVSESESSFILRNDKVSGRITSSNLKSMNNVDSCNSSLDVNDHLKYNIMLNENEGSEICDSPLSKNAILSRESQNLDDKTAAKMSVVPAEPFSISQYAHMEEIEKEMLEFNGTSYMPFLGRVPQQALNKNSSVACDEFSFLDGSSKHSAEHPELQKPSISIEKVDQNMVAAHFNEQLEEGNIFEPQSTLEKCDASIVVSGYHYISTHPASVLQDGYADLGGKNVFPHLNDSDISSIVQSCSSNGNVEYNHDLVNRVATSELEPISQSNHQTSGTIIDSSSNAAFLGNKESVSLVKREEKLTDGCIMQEVVNVSKINTLSLETEDSFSHSSCSSKSDVLDNLSDMNDKIEKENAAISLKTDIKRTTGALTIKPPANAVPFSDEWLAALEAAGEDILTMKGGAVQNSPPEKSVPEPSPWSPVKRKNNQEIGPYDCTKFNGTNIPDSNSH